MALKRFVSSQYFRYALILGFLVTALPAAYVVGTWHSATVGSATSACPPGEELFEYSYVPDSNQPLPPDAEIVYRDGLRLVHVQDCVAKRQPAMASSLTPDFDCLMTCTDPTGTECLDVQVGPWRVNLYKNSWGVLAPVNVAYCD